MLWNSIKESCQLLIAEDFLSTIVLGKPFIRFIQYDISYYIAVMLERVVYYCQWDTMHNDTALLDLRMTDLLDFLWASILTSFLKRI